MNKSRLLIGVFGVLIAIIFYVNALEYPRAAAQMPLIYSVAVALLSLGVIVQEMFKLKAAISRVGEQEMTKEAQDDEERTSTGKRRLAVVAIFSLAVVYVWLLPYLGYLLSTVAFMLASLTILRSTSVKFALIGVAVLVTVVWLVFLEFLGLSIPLLPTLV